MLLGRILGWLLLALALLALGGDGLRWLETGRTAFISLGDFWRRLDAGSLDFIQSLIPPAAWEPGIVTLLGWPAVVTLGVLGLVLLILFRDRTPRRRQRFGALS